MILVLILGLGLVERGKWEVSSEENGNGGGGDIHERRI